MGLGNRPDNRIRWIDGYSACHGYVVWGLAPAESLHTGVLKEYGTYDIINSESLHLWRDVSMKSFVCSLCHNGILGGGLFLDSQSLTYKTNKLTVDKKYRNLVLPMQEIKEISWKWIVFPVATVNMKNGEQYKFIIFNKPRFEKWFQEYSR